jgi:hypothetical protein
MQAVEVVVLVHTTVVAPQQLLLVVQVAVVGVPVY